jgi:sugar lactone lactonase YvrE
MDPLERLMSFAARCSTYSGVGPVLLATLALTTAALIAACNFPADDNATVGSKGLWVANGTNVVEYNPAQLSAGTAASAPHVSINSAVFGMPQGVAFDPGGNLWVVDPAGMINGTATPALFEFSAAQLAALATDNAPDPVATITSALLKSPRQIVIDVLGNAWVTDHDSNTMLVFTAAQLGQSGANKSDPVLLVTSQQFNGPSGIAFDSSGNLWISNNGIPQGGAQEFGGGTTIIEVTAAHVPALPESGTTPRNIVSDATLSDENQASIQSPWALAFDATGNLWSSNAATSTVVRFATSQLTTGAPVPDATISSTKVAGSASVDEPHGVCIDDAGNMAIISEAGGSGAFGIAIFKIAGLATGAPAPMTLITGKGSTLNEPEGCAFGPVVK